MRTILHVGLARAASTYLQDSVFAALPTIWLPFADDEGRRLLASIGRDDQISFDEVAVAAAVRNRIETPPPRNG